MRIFISLMKASNKHKGNRHLALHIIRLILMVLNKHKKIIYLYENNIKEIYLLIKLKKVKV